MLKLGRTLALALLIAAGFLAAGCITSWTETYHDYPPEAYTTPPHAHDQANPTPY